MESLQRIALRPRHEVWRHWSKVATLVLIVALVGLIATSTVWAQTESPRGTDTDSAGSPSGAALQAASWMATIPYGALKVGFAIVGGTVGGLTYVCSGGNLDAAKSVWTTTMYGTYVLTPEHLKGQRPIRFLGVPDKVSELAMTKQY